MLERDTQEVQIRVSPNRERPGADHPCREVKANVFLPSRPDYPCYTADVILGEALPVSKRDGLHEDWELGPFPMSVDDAYERWLFHGPSFRGIHRIEGINEKGISSLLQPFSPSACFQQAVPGQWVIDPVLLDSAFQMAILWERHYFDMTPLPSGFAECRLFHRSPRFPVHCYLEANASADGQVLSTNIRFLDPEGYIVAVVKGMDFSCSKALNRLSGCIEAQGGAAQ